jgi:hypothetical protein
MISTHPKAMLVSPDVRGTPAEQKSDVERFFRLAGYPVPIDKPVAAWGAWEGEELVGCLALCLEDGVEILRGPEIVNRRRRRGYGKALLDAATPQLEGRTLYCVAYTHLLRMYAKAGFGPCAPGEGPEFLRRRVAALVGRGWHVVLLVRSAG